VGWRGEFHHVVKHSLSIEQALLEGRHLRDAIAPKGCFADVSGPTAEALPLDTGPILKNSCI